METKSAIVVGAGLSGLTAAYRLQQAGFHVTVLERNNYPGGRVLTLHENGYTMDQGPDAVSQSYSNYLALADELGLSDQIVPSSPVAGAIKDGQLHDVNLNSPLSIVFTKALSWWAKCRFAIGYLRVFPRLKNIDNFALVESADLDDRSSSAYEFGRKYFGPEVTEYLVDPLMRLVAGTGARKTTHLGLLGGLKAWSSPLVNVLGGLERVPKALAAQLTMRYETEVQRVHSFENRVEIEFKETSGQPHTIAADVCVIGAMFHIARRIYPEINDTIGEFNYEDVKLNTITLGYRQRTRSNAYAVQVPTCEFPDVLLIFFQHNKAPDRSPADCSLITLYTDTLVSDEYAEKTDEELTRWARGHIEKLMPELSGHFELSRVTRWPKAGYLATPGFFTDTRALLDRVPTTSRVQIAGDLFGAGSMESAVTWGNRAANNVLQNYA